MAKVIIFGVGQIAELAHFYLENDSDHEVVAFTVDKEYMIKDEFHDLPVVEYEKVTEEYPPEKYSMFIPISYKKVNKIRAKKYKESKNKGYDFITYISSEARCYSDEIGENSFIMEDNVIQPFTRIGDNCILWSGNHIGHHTIIEDNCFLASHVVVSGSVRIGEYSFIGVNATIRDNIKIGKENVIGASSLILSDTEDKAVFSPKETEKSRVPSNRLRGI
ncbi:acetyltransferase [Orenia marismortui]|uniref:Sugar O-acyltransferase (Sialic acid O-acetyltransferase NeuD family) n=1 Tax=Orenia marismortui TaxID=46469 RepID=A0A4V3H019_9FIRM|nr:acetyltransferase [Orenia marismortui]TDX58919.1 sugar O-acyltransferase (sialic acid O-acetyltransferase NeuD family) [Orenia marismortui]